MRVQIEPPRQVQTVTMPGVVGVVVIAPKFETPSGPRYMIGHSLIA